MLKAYKTEASLNKSQMTKLKQTVGVCRFVYNLFIEINHDRYEHKELYAKNEVYLSAYPFSKWLNNVYLPNNPDKKWIKNVSSKAVKQAIIYADKAYRNFMKGRTGFPNFKEKGVSDPNVYLPKNNQTDFMVERHRIKVPTLGWIKLKEFGYIPINSLNCKVKSCTLSLRAGRVYISVLCETPSNPIHSANGNPIGVDIGIKVLAITSNNIVFENINHTQTMRKLNKQLKRAQRSLARQIENANKNNIKKGDAQNIQKTRLRIQRIYQRLHNIRENYTNKVVNEIVRTKPSYITIEDLNIRGMMKNRHLSKAIQEQCLSTFIRKLICKCHANGIEVRQVSRWYPSSKICHECGCIKTDLKLKDRTFKCPSCGNIIDRDLNAALNLRDCIEYKIAG